VNQETTSWMSSRADAVRPASLADGAIRAGRWAKRRRAMAMGAAAVAVVGLVMGTYLHLAPGQGTAYVPAATDPTVEWTSLPDRLTFRDDYRYGMLVRDADGGSHDYRLPVDPDFDPVGGWAISPDGSSVSVVDGDGLRIGPVSDDLPPLVHRAPMLCGTQTWSPDSREIMVADCSNEQVDLVFVSTVTGEELDRIRDVGALGTAKYMGDGSRLFWGNNRDGYFVADRDGDRRTRLEVGEVPADAESEVLGPVEDDEPYTVSRTVTAVSMDGRYVCHELSRSATSAPEPYVATEFDRDDEDAAMFAMKSATSYTDCDYLLDTSVGGRVEAKDGFIVAAVFGPNGEMMLGVSLADAYRVDLVSSEMDLIDSRVIEDEDLASIYPSPLASYR